jgi:hypothetical protein
MTMKRCWNYLTRSLTSQHKNEQCTKEELSQYLKRQKISVEKWKYIKTINVRVENIIPELRNLDRLMQRET